MRRSGAPSLLKSRPSVDVDAAARSPNENILAAGPKPPEDAVRSTSRILSLLNGVADSSPEENITNNKPVPCNVSVPASRVDAFQETATTMKPPASQEEETDLQKMVFEAVYRKFTAKKHKTWEGDGTVEIEGRSAILKDEDGKELGRASKIKPGIIFEEGTQLTISGRDVELGSCLRSDLVACATKINSSPPAKKFKPFTKNIMASAAPVFTLNPPSASHQWKLNPNGGSVNPVHVEYFLAKVLRPHQKEGIQFLYECVMGMRGPEPGVYWGGVLADEMGLGKTLTCIALLWTLLKQKLYGKGAEIRRALVVAPKTLVDNWEKDIYSWLGPSRIKVFKVDSKGNHLKNYMKSSLAKVAIVSYETYVNQANADQAANQWDLLICDEAHLLKNPDTEKSKVLSRLNCARRILLTGTPIQNNLLEFFELLHFANPMCLGSKQEFISTYKLPIERADEPYCPEEASELGLARREQLQAVTSQFMLRRTRDIIIQYLPPKQDLIIMCRPSHFQVQLYEAAENLWCSNHIKMAPLPSIFTLRQIGSHPALLWSRYRKNLEEDFQQKDTLQEELEKVLKKCNSKNQCDITMLHHSGKLQVVFGILQQLYAGFHNLKCRDRVLIISYYTQTLDLLQTQCNKHGYKCCRLDGTTPHNQRLPMVNKFNDEKSDTFVFLLSAKAGGTGLNLTGASRVILFDLDWNPANDEQALGRIWRGNQKRPVITYRMVMAGTIEEKVFQRQIKKSNLDPATATATLDVKLSKEELKDLFTYHPVDDTSNMTHDMLQCSCDGPTDEPETPQEQAGLFQVAFAQQAHNLGINQLLDWQHWIPPFNITLLQELDLYFAREYMTFVFRNVVSERAGYDGCP